VLNSLCFSSFSISFTFTSHNELRKKRTKSIEWKREQMMMRWCPFVTFTTIDLLLPSLIFLLVVVVFLPRFLLFSSPKKMKRYNREKREREQHVFICPHLSLTSLCLLPSSFSFSLLPCLFLPHPSFISSLFLSSPLGVWINRPKGEEREEWWWWGRKHERRREERCSAFLFRSHHPCSG